MNRHQPLTSIVRVSYIKLVIAPTETLRGQLTGGRFLGVNSNFWNLHSEPYQDKEVVSTRSGVAVPPDVFRSQKWAYRNVVTALDSNYSKVTHGWIVQSSILHADSMLEVECKRAEMSGRGGVSGVKVKFYDVWQIYRHASISTNRDKFISCYWFCRSFLSLQVIFFTLKPLSVSTGGHSSDDSELRNLRNVNSYIFHRMGKWV